ncbi:XRE family transcriptional regulator [Lactococcus cremoris]|uniref:XRE family transcriptional regulator n=1 Tax=Lactococcus lactis subsp. cremoris TaxID=1359 RepID=UPI0015CCF30F|nr:XRE family transcriptional regulator [Lactococcus cremoris]
MKKARKSKGYTQEELAHKLGISKQAYRKYEQSLGLPRENILNQICDILEVDSHYLLNTEILPYYQKLSESHQVEAVEFTKSKLEEQDNENKIINFRNSLIPYKAATEHALSAGLGEGYTDNIETTTVYWDKKVDYDIGIPIKGDSMEPDYQSGQIALIKYQSYPDHDGEVCAVDNVSVGNAFIKCVTCQEDGMLLESLNVEVNQYGERKFPDKKISWEDNPRIIGKVVAAFTPIEINNIF